MRLLSAVVIATAIVSFPALSAAYTGQQFIFTRATFTNGNTCWSQGKNCHIPQRLNTAAVSRPVMTNQAAPVATTPLVPAGSSSGIVSGIVSKVMSIF